jgi:N-succinyldiaminopimelate aminotransferase
MTPIKLSIGEPKHHPPAFVVEALGNPELLISSLGAYPATRGEEALREAIAGWATRRFGLGPRTLTATHHVLPVSGTREALFSFGQAVLSGRAGATALMPNPFYQIYEGSALLRGAEPCFVRCAASTSFKPDFDAISTDAWQRCELVYLCSPGNPTGAVLTEHELQSLIELADRYDFVIAADECYTEIYFDEATPPPGLLGACARLGRDDYRRCVVFHSLSKRSNLPGLRSGFVAGDADILAAYYRYRTYEGCALPQHVQHVSTLAWGDEEHVVENRRQYREKFERVTPALPSSLNVTIPEAGFYYWAETPGADEDFTRALFESTNVTVLPGTYLGRGAGAANPGTGRVRMALVAELEECLEAAERIAGFVDS